MSFERKGFLFWKRTRSRIFDINSKSCLWKNDSEHVSTSLLCVVILIKKKLFSIHKKTKLVIHILLIIFLKYYFSFNFVSKYFICVKN